MASVPDEVSTTKSVTTTTSSSVPSADHQQSEMEISVTSAHTPPLTETSVDTPASPVSFDCQNPNPDGNPTQKQAELSEKMMDVPESSENNVENNEHSSIANETTPAETPDVPMEVVGSIPEKALSKEPVASAMEVENTKVTDSTETTTRPVEIRTRTPLQKEDFLNSPIRSLTPLSENFEQTSPIELMETSDGSVRIKGDLDPSPISHSYHSRSSSQSPKSLKEESPASQLSPAQTKSKKKRPPPPIDERDHDKNDFYCWICHKEGEVLCCELCPRVVHAKCLDMDSEPEGDWYCPECEKIMVAECKETQSRAMAQLSIDQLALHLRYALQRMKTTGCEPFLEPVNTKEFADYLGYVFHPMDLSTLEKNIKKRTYGCTEAFIADVKWILHNCIIYNGHNTKLTQIAKTIVKIAQHEMNEIEVCPECYLNACRKREKWFCEPCKDIHILVWAKLQGFPHWPAKALRIDKGAADVRFFGQHDRAWVAVSGCYLMSKEMPHPVKNKKKGRGPGAKGGLDNALQEMQCYIDNVVRKTGTFEYAPPRTLLTHLDMCRKPTGTKVHAKLPASQGPPTSASSITVKKEMLEEEKEKTNPSVKSALGDRVFKIATNVNLTTVSAPPKKSKIVTTSGAHPQKGCRPYAPKKKASLALLEKTIESCKASLRDTVESESDATTSDSDSSLESESESATTDKSTPDKGEKSLDAKKVEEKNVKPIRGDSNSSAPDRELVIDAPESENAAKKKDMPQSALVETGLVKVKKRAESDATVKPGTKTKSILLNKETESPKKVTTSRPIVNPGIKRKLPGDSPQSATSSNKIRKVDTSSSAGKPDRANPTSQRAGKIQSSFKEKKKINLDDDKMKRHTDNPSSKSTKAANLAVSSGVTSKKAHPSEVSTNKKTQSSAQLKTRLDEPQAKSDLKSAAKLLAKKVMTRKQGLVQGKPKINIQPGVKPPGDSAAKKLSSFTIPKHKVPTTTVETDSPVHNIKVTIGPPASQTVSVSEGNVQSKIPAIDLPMQKLMKYSDKVMQNMQEVLADVYEDMVVMFQSTQHGGASQASFAASVDANSNHQVSKLTLELEQLKWMHQQEMAELQHNHDLTIAEIRQSLENEKVHLIDVAKRKNDAEKAKAVEDAKKKQWCANCGREAIFYCCWNTSYCDYPCQQLHWPKHMPTCSQTRDRGGVAPNGQKNQVPLTPTSPPKPMESKSVPKPAAESKPDEKDVSMNDEDDDQSDNDMMVIDETVHKEAINPAAELLSPQSPEAEVDHGKKPVKNSDVAVAKTETGTTSSTSSSIAKSTSPETLPNVSIGKTSSVVRPLPVVSALASEAKLKNLPLRSTSPIVSTASSAAPTKVVPSKLIDDIFSKVHKKGEVPSSSSQSAPPVATPSIASLKSILDSVSSPATTSAKDSEEIPTTTSLNVDIKSTKSSDKHTAVSQEIKAHSSGSMISAIGERLLKAKIQPAVSDSVSVTKNVTSSTTSSGETTAQSAKTNPQTETVSEDSQVKSEVSCEIAAVVDDSNSDKKTQKEISATENKTSEVDSKTKDDSALPPVPPPSDPSLDEVKELPQTPSDDVPAPSSNEKPTDADQSEEKVPAKIPREREDEIKTVEKDSNKQDESSKPQSPSGNAVPTPCSSPDPPTQISTTSETASVTQLASSTPASTSPLSHQASVAVPARDTQEKTEVPPSDVSPSSPPVTNTSSMLSDVSSPVFSDPYLSSLPQVTTAQTKLDESIDHKSKSSTVAMETDDSET